jgi:poly(A) polymerase
LLRIILPELDSLQLQSEWNNTLRRLEQLERPSFELAMSALLMSVDHKTVVLDICRRLKLSNHETDRIAWLVEHQQDLEQADRLSLAKLKRGLAHPFKDDLLKLMAADRQATSSPMNSVIFCREFLDRTPVDEIDPVPFVTGDDLIGLGLKPGPQFKSILETIRDAQLNLEISNQKDGLALARTLKGSPDRG